MALYDLGNVSHVYVPIRRRLKYGNGMERFWKFVIDPFGNVTVTEIKNTRITN